MRQGTQYYQYSGSKLPIYKAAVPYNPNVAQNDTGNLNDHGLHITLLSQLKSLLNDHRTRIGNEGTVWS